MVSVVIPDSVLTIDLKAFFGCDKLTNITMSNNIVEIKEDAINSERDFRKTQQKTPNNIGNSLQMIA